MFLVWIVAVAFVVLLDSRSELLFKQKAKRDFLFVSFLSDSLQRKH